MTDVINPQQQQNQQHDASKHSITAQSEIIVNPQQAHAKGEATASRQDLLVDKESGNDFLCPICNDLFVIPVETSCGHVFCQACLQQALGVKKCCPFDRRALTPTEIHESKWIRRKVGQLQAMCPYHETGCKWRGELDRTYEHLRDRCQHVQFRCCGQVFSRQDHISHQNEHARQTVVGSVEAKEIFEEQMDMWHIRQAVHHFSYEQNGDAISILEQLCQHRNPHALTLMAHCYAKGLGVPANDKTAFDLYTLAARQAHPRAMYYLASAYAGGKGCDTNWGNAFDLLLEAAKLGDSFAQYSLGMMFELGQSTRMDLNLARRYFEEAARQGHAAALSKLVKYYADGIGDVASTMSLEERKKKAAECSHDSKLRMEMAKSRLHPRSQVQQTGVGSNSSPQVQERPPAAQQQQQQQQQTINQQQLQQQQQPLAQPAQHHPQ